MSSLNKPEPIRPGVLEEAAGWLVEFRAGDPDAADRRSFDHWLRASPEHVRAYLTLLPTWENDAFPKPGGETNVDELIRQARGSDSNVVPYAQRPIRQGTPTVQNNRKRILAAAGVLLACGVAGYFAYLSRQSPAYATRTGEQISIALEDGSTVSLNSRSKIRVRYSAQQRFVELEDGQALFQVAKDAARPFIVSSGEAQIRAVGTQFDVYRKSVGTVVTVVEGRVAVKEVLLSAGEQITVAPAATFEPVAVDTKVATAWTQRRLIFSAAPLREVAAEFNRYNSRRLVIDAGELDNFRINGIFSSADPAALLNFLREQPGIGIAETDAEIRVVRK